MSCAVSLTTAVKCLKLLQRQCVLCRKFDNGISVPSYRDNVSCAASLTMAVKVSLATSETMCLLQEV